MAQPVWVLSVDLQTKTATFQTGMADAARSARESFKDIQGGAGEMGRETNYSMMEARHGVMMLGEEFNIRLPRAVSSFIASIGPIGAAMNAAFPFLAIIALAGILIEKLQKMHESGEKLTTDQLAFGTAVNNAFRSLDDKLLQAQIRADELNKNHIGALHRQLELIDHQSMSELMHTFGELAKVTDTVMKDLEGHWYTFGKGSEGAKQALDAFQAKYDNLLSSDKAGASDEASGLLHGTAAQAQKVLSLLQQLQASGKGMNPFSGFADPAKWHAAEDALNSMKIAHGQSVETEIKAQQNLVDVLNAQVEAEQRVKDIKKIEDSNAVKTEQLADTKDANKHGEEVLKYNEALNRRMAEDDKQSTEGLVSRERENVAATISGSQQRLDAINAAIQEEAAYGRTGTSAYKQLVAERLQLTHQMTDEQARLLAEAGKQSAENDLKTTEQQVEQDREAYALMNSTRRISLERQVEQQTAIANVLYAAKQQAFAREASALDKSDKDYANKLKAIQDKEKQLTQAHENEITAIKDKAEMERNQKILAAETRMQDSIAAGLTKSIMGHQGWARMVTALGDQVVSGMMENAIKSALADDFTKEKDAAAAARKAYNIGLSIGGPAGVILGPVFGAAAFASVMAFQGGTDSVPGINGGDTVPAMLERGEGVVPGGIMDNLNKMAREGGFQQHQRPVTVHVRPTYHVNTIDGDGMRDVLEQHSDQLTAHFQKVVRGMNK